jgi:uncharacterized protein YprB with RNaseH-like and TPR domain
VSSVVFDIETGPGSDEVLKELFVPKTREEFVGDRNWKAETVEANYKKYLDGALEEFKRSAALNAISGQVLAIGYRSIDKKVIHGQGEESEGRAMTEFDVLSKFWHYYQQLRAASRSLIGFNIKDFDIPFIVQRSIIQGIAIPPSLFSGNGRYLDSLFVDLRDVWKAGVFNGKGSLDAICRACGIGAKTEGVDGSMFAELWMGGSEKRAIAKHYLLNDLDMTWQLADRCNAL